MLVRQRRRRRRGLVALGCRIGVAGLLLVTCVDSVDADPIRIEVDTDQRVTISGSFDSLRESLTTICDQAGVELRAFEAADRPFSADYDSVPLTEAVSRLLRSEVFIAGMRPDQNGGGTRLSWLLVSGSNGGVANVLTVRAAPAASPQASGFDFGPNPRLVETALTSKDPTARGRARAAILESLRDDPSSIQRFVDRDTELAVEELTPFPHSAEFLRALQTVTLDPDERAQIQQVLGKVQVRQAID